MSSTDVSAVAASLTPLTPDYIPERHATYADALERAIRGGQVANVALAGSYGSGKSSILRSVVQRFPGQVAEVALSPLPASSAGSDPDENDIQKEIVKQLLYVVDPAHARASKFPRASKDKWLRAAGWAAGVGAIGVALQSIVAVVMVLLGSGELTLDLLLSFATFSAVTVLAFLFRRLTAGHWSIRDIKAGPTGLTISRDEVTYFDKYLDEIVYFFQLSKKRVVVFEDMDRFDSTEIFASLRALNQLLNNAAQLKPEAVFSSVNRWMAKRAADGRHRVVGGPIVFVYAVRDSLIPVPADRAQAGSDSDAAADRFIRTKFFDLIIPVVPSVTPSNAREALTAEFMSLGEHGVDPNLRRAVAQYFPDLRQLRNIRNEFQIYRERLIPPGRSLDQLGPDRLFALIAYKNADPADFEMIRLGTSKLDTARDFAVRLSAQHLAAATERLEVPSAKRMADSASQFGKKLAARSEVLGLTLYNDQTGSYFSTEQLSSLEVLRQIANGSVRLRADRGSEAMTIPDLEALAGLSLDFADHDNSEITALELDQLREEHTALEYATWKSLYDTPQYAYSASEDTDLRFEAYDGYNFVQYVHDQFGEGLVPALISRDMLTRDFALFITEYAGAHISVTARSFVNRVLERPLRTGSLPISRVDIEQILEEHTEDILSRAGMVNVDVLAYLLIHKASAAERIVRQLAPMTAVDHDFLDDFFGRPSEGENDATASQGLAISLAQTSGAILDYLARSQRLESGQLVELFGKALGDVRLSTLTNSNWTAARTYANEQQAHLLVLREDTQESANAATALVRLGVSIADVHPLSRAAREVVVELGGFDLTSRNLMLLDGSAPGGSLALDDLLRRNRPLYNAVTKRLDQYLSLELPPDSVVIESSDGLLDVLNNLADQMPDDERAASLLLAVAQLLSGEVVIDDVSHVSPRVRNTLFAALRAAPSVRNLTSAADAEGLGGSAALLLASTRRVEYANESAKERRALANHIVKLATAHPEELSPGIVVEIVDSLRIKDPLDISVIAAAPAPLAAALTRAMHVNANELAGVVKPSSPWDLREAFLEQSPENAWQLAVPLVATEDVPAFLANASIPVAARMEALRNVDVLLGANIMEAPAAADAILLFALRRQSPVLAADLVALAHYTTEPSLVLRLMLLNVNTGAWDSVVLILGELGEPYAAIFDMDLKSPKFPVDKTHRRFLAQLQEQGHLRVLGRKTKDDLLSIKRVRDDT